jgi:hypothetical protein
MSQETVLIISGKVVRNNAKIDWPDLNYPGSGETILRYLHCIDFVNLKFQLDGEDGPWFTSGKLPDGVAFYKKYT